VEVTLWFSEYAMLVQLNDPASTVLLVSSFMMDHVKSMLSFMKLQKVYTDPVKSSPRS